MKPGKIIFTDDEEWLNGAGNLVGDERVVEVLDNESDYDGESTLVRSHK